MKEIKKIELFVRDFFKKWKHSTSSKENVFFGGVNHPSVLFPSNTEKNWKKYTTFWKLKITYFILRITGKVRIRGPPPKTILRYIYTKHRESYKKRWFFIPKKLYTFIWFAVFGGRGIMRGDFFCGLPRFLTWPIIQRIKKVIFHDF